MNAAAIAEALGGPRREGGGFRCRCPLASEHTHGDADPSLTITDSGDGKVLVHCFSRHADEQDRVVDELRRLGWWPSGPGKGNGHVHGTTPEPAAGDAPTDDSEAEELGVREAPLASDQTHRGTPAEAYLRSRGITIPIPPALRFCRNLKHPSGPYPRDAMVAGVQCVDGAFSAIYRTFLDGCSKTKLKPVKAALGPIAGRAMRLAPPGPKLLLAEGIETGLSVMQATSLPVWVTLGTEFFSLVELPGEVREVIICADGDPAGVLAAKKQAQRFLAQGREVRIAKAKRGQDFNDYLTREAS